jgi:hypothetical protein
MDYAFCDSESDVNAMVRKARNNGLSLAGSVTNNSSRTSRAGVEKVLM